jgi:AcrR family transcriptional regulator
MFDMVYEWGASSVTVAHIVQRAGVSRRTFYELFDDREDCFLAAFERALAYASERVLSAYEAQRGWRERIRAALIALLSFFDEEPVIGRLLIVDSFGEAVTFARRGEVIAKLTSAIEQGRTLKGTPHGVAQAGARGKASLMPPSFTGEGLVGGVLTAIQSRLVGDNRESLVELANPLMSMIVLPYLGASAARGELERPVPVCSAGARVEPLLSDPFKDAGMRLTYRTVRVLTAVADHPGASNRLVADTAEISDQGQISKLLTRLERVGVIANTGLGPGQGAPNAWTLTANGRHVVNSISAHTADSEHGGVPA